MDRRAAGMAATLAASSAAIKESAQPRGRLGALALLARDTGETRCQRAALGETGGATDE